MQQRPPTSPPAHRWLSTSAESALLVGRLWALEHENRSARALALDAIERWLKRHFVWFAFERCAAARGQTGGGSCLDAALPHRGLMLFVSELPTGDKHDHTLHLAALSLLIAFAFAPLGGVHAQPTTRSQATTPSIIGVWKATTPGRAKGLVFKGELVVNVQTGSHQYRGVLTLRYPDGKRIVVQDSRISVQGSKVTSNARCLAF